MPSPAQEISTHEKPGHRSLLNREFPLYIKGEFDFFFESYREQVGLDSALPGETKRKIIAALIGDAIGVKSVDYVLRSYLKDVEYPDQSGPRLDRQVRSHIEHAMGLLANAVTTVSFERDKPGPFHIALFAVLRAKFSMEICCYAIQRGALFEAVACQRMLLEKLAFASRIIYEPDEADVLGIKPQSCLAHLNTRAPKAGRYYGWLSRHAHWEPSAHVQAFTRKGDKMGHLFASTEWKAVSFLSALVLIDKYLCFIDSTLPHDMALSGELRHYSKADLDGVACENHRHANSIVDLLKRDKRAVELLDMLSLTG